jgi:biopolymer transport protein TolQ
MSPPGSAQGQVSGVASIFESGFREFGRMRQHGAIGSDQIIEGSRRAMRAALLKETDRLEKACRCWLPSVRPVLHRPVRYGVGHHERISRSGGAAQVTLAQVAPGISEAWLPQPWVCLQRFLR